MKKLIYLDNAATTKTSEEVVAAMLPYFTEYYGNPSSVYEFASESKKAFQMQEERSQRLWEHRKMRFISQPVVPRQITGH